MGSLFQAKVLGVIGAILTLLLLVPYFVGTVLVIFGWILILVALGRISDEVEDRSIYSNARISVILAIVGIFTFAAAVAGAVLGFIGLGALSSAGSAAPAPDITTLEAGILDGLVVVWILAMVSAYFLIRSLRTVAARVDVGWFATSALLYFIGTILTIVLVGFVLMLVAQILLLVAFLSLPDTVEPADTTSQTIGPPPPPPA
jgi:uncharacterized membrane protein